MTTEMALRHTLELAILLPAMLIAFLPVRGHLRFRPAAVFASAVCAATLFSIFGGLICANRSLRSNSLLLPALPLFLAAFCFCVELPFLKKLFCFCNAAMLCAFCTFYTYILTAPAEVGLDDEPFLISTSFICLLLSAAVILIFLRTLCTKLPYLLEEERLDRIWTTLSPVALGMMMLFYYMTPQSASVITTGRVRPVTLVMTVFFPAAMFALYHGIWWTASRISENAKLIEENHLLQMERKRYEELDAYVDKVRILRHDFRQHLLAIDQYAKNGDTDGLRTYIRQLDQLSDVGFTRYCANSAVDAVAAHYTAIAEQLPARIDWSLRLAETLPWEAADLCALFGNLVDNALRAVASLPEGQRSIAVTSQSLSESMLGIAIENPYSGVIEFDQSGLPVTRRRDHGIGMKSVASIVERYHGTLSVQAENGIFSVNMGMGN